MSKVKNLSYENYLWSNGEALRKKYEHAWWLGYRAKKAGLADEIPSGFSWSQPERDAFHSGYEYRRDMYDE